jgi:hypothetical protein
MPGFWNPTAHQRGQALGLDMVAGVGDQLVAALGGEVGDADRVGPVGRTGLRTILAATRARPSSS